MSAASSSPESGSCTVAVDCVGTNVTLQVTAPNSADNDGAAASHQFVPVSKKAGADRLDMTGSFVGDPATMPAKINQELSDAVDAAGIDPQWGSVIARYGVAQYGKIRTREQFRRVLEQRNGHGNDHVDAPLSAGPSSAGARNSGAKTGHSGMTRRSGER